MQQIAVADADVKMEMECLPACGSFSYCAAAAVAAAMVSEETDTAMTAVCGLFFSCAAAAVSEETTAVADANLFKQKGCTKTYILFALNFRLRTSDVPITTLCLTVSVAIIGISLVSG